jgi:hypothetical protein
MNMKTHEAAALFPLLEGDEFDALVKDIKKNGQQQPIYRYEGKIIDGRNRLRAIAKLKLDPWIEDVDPEEVGDPIRFVMSMNYHRRHLSALDKGRALKAYLESRGGKKAGRGRPKKSESRTLSVNGIAKELGIPKQTAHDQIQAAEDYESLPKPVKVKVDAGEISVAVAKDVVKKTPAKVIEDSGKHDSPRAKAAQKVIDKGAEEAKQHAAFHLWWKRTVLGFSHWAPWMAQNKLSKAMRDSIRRDIQRIKKSIKEMNL